MSQPVKVFDKSACQAQCLQGIKAMSLTASALQISQCVDYLELLFKWNQRLNLTAIRNPQEMVSRHLLDSLSVMPYLHGDRIIDVGTGAGLPGIPLAIMNPNLNFFLLDSNHKKQVFVSQVVKSLSLKNVQCVHSEVKAYQPTEKFSTIVTRAFAPLSLMLALTEHLLADKGRFLAMLGRLEQETLSLPPGFEIEHMVSLRVPQENAQRHLGIIARI
ncbi:MAG: 16S rRNA (guanine(527)-N(7))-methyltransferase RsmG [Proteobacteria bacterium]|nr:16S rRNA (guanine(527)-N(7))-methyltransferase RsmG [Pseudomonadota bacterium]